MRKYNEFQKFLYCRFIFDKRYTVQDVARKMNLPASTLYHYIEGENAFPVDLLGSLYNATSDPEIINYLLKDTDVMLTPRQKSSEGKSILDETLEAVVATGRVVDTIQKALDDGRIDRNERDTINEAINLGLKELEGLRKIVNENEQAAHCPRKIKLRIH